MTESRTEPVARLTGPRPGLDPRRFIARGEVVDIALAGAVSAASYVAPAAMVCIAPRTPIRAHDNADAAAVSELLFGEDFDLFDISGEWGFGRSVHDGYTGWVALRAIDPRGARPDHRVSARVAPVFARPDIKAPVRFELPLGAWVSGPADGKFVAVTGGGYLHHRHLDPLPSTPLAVARRFAGAPYLWGGRTPLGVDCSGLVQAALTACGVVCPRDSDQQRDEIGVAVDFAERQGGDLVFFPGHVGILADADTLFHANAHWMATVEEPLADVIARGVEVMAVRRIP